jgi:hypothetical protein
MGSRRILSHVLTGLRLSGCMKTDKNRKSAHLEMRCGEADCSINMKEWPGCMDRSAILRDSNVFTNVCTVTLVMLAF